MKTNLIFLAAAAFVTACSSSTPAPYEVYGTRYYGKNGQGSTYSSNATIANSSTVQSHPIINSNSDDYAANTNYSKNPNDDYNRNIDQQNAGNVTTRPLKNGEVYSYQKDSSGNSSHALAPVAIDGDQPVVRVNGQHPQNIHSGGSYTTAADAPRTGLIHEPVQEEETVPPVDKKDGYVNPSQVNQERKSTDAFSKIKPVPKPHVKQDDAETETVTPAPVQPATVQHAKPKITAKIEKIETSAGEVDKSTVGMINQPQKAEDNNAPDDSEADAEKAADEKPASQPKLLQNKEAAQPAADANDDDAETVPVADAPAPAKAVTAAKPASAKGGPQFIKPVDGVVISEFGPDKNGGAFNDGISIQAPEGTPVKAAGAGTVVYSGNQLQGYGNMVIIRHANGFLSAYSHLKELDLKKGQVVSQGDIVGHVGKTGNVDTPQLHFGIRKGHEPVDPKDYLNTGA